MQNATSSNPSLTTPKPSRTDVRRLQGEALCDERTAIKALTDGPNTVRGIVGERCAQAMVKLGLRPLRATEAA